MNNSGISQGSLSPCQCQRQHGLTVTETQIQLTLTFGMQSGPPWSPEARLLFISSRGRDAAAFVDVAQFGPSAATSPAEVGASLDTIIRSDIFIKPACSLCNADEPGRNRLLANVWT